MAALALQRLAFITGETRYALAAERTIALFHARMRERPSGYATLLTALAETLEPTRTIILRGPAAALGPWQRALASHYLPGTLVLAVPDAAGVRLPMALAKPPGGSAGVNAWVCQGVTCLPPVTSLQDLLEGLHPSSA